MCSFPLYNSPVPIVSSAPTRIDLAGGTIDIWPLYLFHDGASTVNAAISLRAHATLATRDDGRIELHSVETDRRIIATDWPALNGSGDLTCSCGWPATGGSKTPRSRRAASRRPAPESPARRR